MIAIQSMMRPFLQEINAHILASRHFARIMAKV